MSYPTQRISEFMEAFNKFLMHPNHVICICAISNEFCFHVDPTSFIVKFLHDVFHHSRNSIQFKNHDTNQQNATTIIWDMTLAYRDFRELVEYEFDPINRLLLEFVQQCQTDDCLEQELKWILDKLDQRKLLAWNTQIREACVYQLVRSTHRNYQIFCSETQVEYKNLHLSVATMNENDRKLIFWDRTKTKQVLSIEQIQYRGVVTTPKNKVTVIEFAGFYTNLTAATETHHDSTVEARCKTRMENEAPTSGSCGKVVFGRHLNYALFRMRGKGSTILPQGAKPICAEYALLDLIANYLDKRNT